MTNPELREPFLHSLILLIYFSALPIILGLALAWLMTRSRVRGSSVFRTVIFVPQVIAMVVVAIAWRQIYAPDGALNDALSFVGLGHLRHAWLGDSTYALLGCRPGRHLGRHGAVHGALPRRSGEGAA